MAEKAFYVHGTFSGRETPLSGGPKVSGKKSSLDFTYRQRHMGESREVIRIRGTQDKMTVKTLIEITPPGGETITHEIETYFGGE